MTRDSQPPITPASVREILRDEPSPYSTQFSLGFRSLSFLPELEREFRDFYLSHNPGQLKRVLPVALVLTLLFMVSDYLRLPAETLNAILWPRIPQFLSLCLLALVVFRNRQSLIEPAVALTLIVYGTTTPLIMIELGSTLLPVAAAALHE